MDRFRQHFTSTQKPTSPFHGNKENEFSEEFSHKLKLSDKKRLPVAKNKVSVKRSKTLDVEDQPELLRSFSFDENVSRFDSSLPPYDPVKNYLSPRPKFLMYNPDRRREILFRQEKVNGVRKSALFDDGMLFSEEETESSVECYLDASSGDECFVEKVEVIDEFVSSSEDENVEEFEEYSGWSLSVFLQYLFVMIVLILTTMSISSMNSPIVTPARESIRDLYLKTRGSVYRAIGVNFSEVGSKPFDSTILVAGKLSPSKIDNGDNELANKDFAVQTDGLAEVQYEQTKDVCEDEVVELETGETKEVVNDTENVSWDDMWINNDSEQFQSSRIYESKEVQVKEIEQYEEISYQIQEPVIPVRKEIDSQEIEAQKEVYSQLSWDDSNQNEVSVESEFESKIEGIQNTDDYIKLASFDPIYMGIFALILVATSVLYYSTVARKKTVVPAMELVNRGELTSSYVGFGTTGSVFSESQESNFYQSRWKNNMSPTKTESSSSSHKSSSHFGRSTGDSPTHGSFTVEKKIIKKNKSQTPEVIISTVRRSSRINNRSFSSP